MKFTNFYWYFIQNFSRIAAPLTLIIKRTKLFIKLAFGVDDKKIIHSGNAESGGSVG